MKDKKLEEHMKKAKKVVESWPVSRQKTLELKQPTAREINRNFDGIIRFLQRSCEKGKK